MTVILFVEEVSAICAGAPLFRTSILSATALSLIAEPFGSTLMPPVMNCTASRIIASGTTKASMTTVTSCFGVRIKGCSYKVCLSLSPGDDCFDEFSVVELSGDYKRNS